MVSYGVHRVGRTCPMQVFPQKIYSRVRNLAVSKCKNVHSSPDVFAVCLGQTLD